MIDYYKILQVDPAADEEVIRAAYQRIISKLHPDKNPSPGAEQRAQQVNEAYSILSAPLLREQYDKARPATPSLEEVRRTEDLRRQALRRREEAEEALRFCNEQAQAKQCKLEEVLGRLEAEEYRRQEAEAKLAVWEKAEALRRGFIIENIGRKTLGRTGRLAWFGGGGLSVLATLLLFDHQIFPAASTALEPEMVPIKGGCYEMGSPDSEPERSPAEGPRHSVCLSDFQISKYEVTFEEYDRYARATGQPLPDDNGWGRGTRPVININWNDVTAYAQWLSQQTGKHYRLPTEAEWEYAALAGANTAFTSGECINTGFANYDGRTDYARCGAQTGVYLGKTQPVGTYPANLWGLHDIQGNIWEWVADCWHGGYQGAPADGSAWEAGGDCEAHGVRGGAWDSGPSALRAAYRGHWEGGYRYVDLGFRLAKE